MCLKDRGEKKWVGKHLPFSKIKSLFHTAINACPELLWQSRLPVRSQWRCQEIISEHKHIRPFPTATRQSIYIFPYELCCAVVMSWESMFRFLENLKNNIVTYIAFCSFISPVKKQQVIKHVVFTGSLPSPLKWLWFFAPCIVDSWGRGRFPGSHCISVCPSNKCGASAVVTAGFKKTSSCRNI